MKDYLNLNSGITAAESAEDAVLPTELLEKRLNELNTALEKISDNDPEYIGNLIEQAYIQIDLEKKVDAHQNGHLAFKKALSQDDWQQAVEALDVIFQAEQDDAATALGHGIWLSVTFPIDPELTVAMLQHFIDDSPDRSDGAAVCAAVACYVVDLRIEEQQKREDLKFFTNQMLGQVARTHSQVEEQEIFDFWIEQLELNDPAKFIPKLGKIVEVIVGDNWWFDRDELRNKIPEDV